MNNPFSELYVYYIERNPGDIAASARCGEQDVHLGDVFRYAYSYEYAKGYEEAEEEPPPIQRDRAEVCLRVIYMERYQESVSVLKLGDTARVVFTGTGTELVGQTRDVLSTG